jgi:hypothetical protein
MKIRHGTACTAVDAARRLMHIGVRATNNLRLESRPMPVFWIASRESIYSRPPRGRGSNRPGSRFQAAGTPGLAVRVWQESVPQDGHLPWNPVGGGPIGPGGGEPATPPGGTPPGGTPPGDPVPPGVRVVLHDCGPDTRRALKKRCEESNPDKTCLDPVCIQWHIYNTGDPYRPEIRFTMDCVCVDQAPPEDETPEPEPDPEPDGGSGLPMVV